MINFALIFSNRESLSVCHEMVFKSFLSCGDHLSLGNPERHEEPEEENTCTCVLRYQL